MTETRPLATAQEVADWLQVTTDQLSKLRIAGTGPTFIRYPGDRIVRYAWKDVHEWADRLRRTTTKDIADE